MQSTGANCFDKNRGGLGKEARRVLSGASEAK